MRYYFISAFDRTLNIPHLIDFLIWFDLIEKVANNICVVTFLHLPRSFFSIHDVWCMILPSYTVTVLLDDCSVSLHRLWRHCIERADVCMPRCFPTFCYRHLVKIPDSIITLAGSGSNTTMPNRGLTAEQRTGALCLFELCRLIGFNLRPSPVTGQRPSFIRC